MRVPSRASLFVMALARRRHFRVRGRPPWPKASPSGRAPSGARSTRPGKAGGRPNSEMARRKFPADFPTRLRASGSPGGFFRRLVEKELVAHVAFRYGALPREGIAR
jgi:hypothetical protein